MKFHYDREHFFSTIIGGGPAGASCSLWLKHLAVPSILFEKEATLGGLQRIAPNPLSNHYLVSSAGMRAQQIAESIHENLSRHGVNFVPQAEVVKVTDDGDWFHIKAKSPNGCYEVSSRHIVLATGVEHKRDGFTPSQNVFIGSADNKIRVQSVKFFKDKRVAILGGGDNAMEAYEFIAAQAPADVLVFARNLRASKARMAMVNREHILGLENGYDVFVNKGHGGLHVITCRDDPYARYTFDFLIVNYGFTPISVLPPGIDPKRNLSGFIEVNNECVTSHPRILAIGESTQRMHPCVATAMADGVVAAKVLERRYVQSIESESEAVEDAFPATTRNRP